MKIKLELLNLNRRIKMNDNDKIIKFVKKEIVRYFNERHTDYKLTVDDIYIVWFCKTIQNFKILASYDYTDHMYYEFTFNGDKKEIYMDCYKKTDKIIIPFDINVDNFNNKWYNKNG